MPASLRLSWCLDSVSLGWSYAGVSGVWTALLMPHLSALVVQ